MNPTADLSILTLITQASPVVQIVLAILILLSLLSWTVIFRKFFAVSRALRQTDEFESRFWSGTELTKLLEVANRNREASGMEERIFAAGMNEFLKQQRAPVMPSTVFRARCARFLPAKWIISKAACRCSPRSVRPRLYRPLRHGLGDHERLYGPLDS